MSSLSLRSLLTILTASVPGWCRPFSLVLLALLSLVFSLGASAQGLSDLNEKAVSDAKSFGSVAMPLLGAIAVFALLTFLVYTVLQVILKSSDSD